MVSPEDEPGGMVTLIETPEGKGIWTQKHIVTRTDAVWKKWVLIWTSEKILVYSVEIRKKMPRVVSRNTGNWPTRMTTVSSIRSTSDSSKA